ncbi:MAG: hypothetical protein DYG94_12340 [Leptolyngbya sp. PLA3]|nr:MAG: hypothetical protein EDM82_12805 [Cyanobacteria bacterium CYA]MCE7969514.1 hypothetical protein [Leptolyngbya sp. PL-A3]
MASRVNIKLVVALIIGLVAVGGGGMYLYFGVLNKSAADNAAEGDKAMAAGDYGLARRMYARAVNKEPTSVVWLTKWGEAIEKWKPATETDFENEFRTAYVPMLRGLAMAQPASTEPTHKYLKMVFEQTVQSDYQRGSVEQLDLETEQFLARMQLAAAGKDDFLTIRRYRGLVYTGLLQNNRPVEDAKRKLAEEDLRAVLDVDPNDGEATVGLMRILETQAREDRAAGRRERFAENRAAAMKVLDEHLARDPNDPDVLLNRLALQIDSARDAAMEGKVGAEAMRALSAASAQFEPQVVELAQRLATTTETFNVDLVQRFQSMEAVVLPENNYELTMDVIDSLVARFPGNARVLMRKASVQADRREFEGASATVASVSALPALPVSAEGVALNRQKVLAYAFRADLELRLRDSLPRTEEAARRAALERATVARGEFAKRVPEDNPMLLFIDASLAEANGDLRKAQNLIQRYNQVMANADVRGLWFEGQVSIALNEYGRAKTAFETIIAGSNNPSAKFMLAGVERAMQNKQRALELYREVASINPDDQSIRQQINELEVELNITQSDDPVKQVLVNANLAVNPSDGSPGNVINAIDILQKGAEANNYSPAISLQLANFLLGSNRIDEARQAVGKALEVHPGDEQLQTVSEALKSDDVFGVSMMLVDASKAEPVEKLINKFSLCQMYNRPEEADRVVSELAALAPNDRRVIEVRFISALGKKDAAGARQIYEAALQAGLLDYDGLIYRSRIEAFEGKHQDAINTLTRAIELGADQASVWRLLGAQQYENGQLQAAIESYRKACDIQPTDIQNVKPLLEMLAQAGQGDEALRRAREAERFGRGDAQFVNLWLQLEARAGGQEGISRAILVRQQRASIDPSDRVNQMELASLHMDVASSNLPTLTEAARRESWASARTIIDGLKQGQAEPDLRVVMLEARWFADQGRVTLPDGTVADGIDQARGIFIDYIIGLGDKASAVPYIELARFMTQRGRYAIAKQALSGAREYQSDQLEAEKVLAALHMELGEFADAEPLFEKIVSAGVDDEGESYRIRWIEMLLRQGKYEQASELLGNLRPDLSDTLTVLLQRAEVADGMGNAAESGRLLDRAVSLFASNPLPYTRRAEFRVRDPRLITDVLEDLQQALNLAPNDTQTLRLRAGVYGSLGRYDDMLNDLISALRANPYQTDVLQAIMVEFILKGQDGRAMDVVEETLRARPRDLMLLARAGRIFDERQLWNRSAVLYERGWQLSADPGFGMALINALISQTPPKTQIADRTLRELKALGEKVAGDWQIAFTEAAIKFKAGRKQEAETALAGQFPTLAGNPNEVAKWWSNMRGLYGDSGGLEAFMRTLVGAQQPDSVAQRWAAMFLAQLLVDGGSDREEGFRMLEDMMKLSEQGFVLLAYRQAGTAHYAAEDYEKALDVWKRGLEVFPNDWEMSNNAAYALATRLNRAAEALPFAQAAVAANPEQAEVYDTLARVHLGMNDLEAASSDLDTARKYVRSKRAEMSVTLTQCELDFQNRKIAKARRVLERSLLAITPVPDLRAEFEAPIRDLLRRIESLGE